MCDEDLIAGIIGRGLLATLSPYTKAPLFLAKGYPLKVDDIVSNALFHRRLNELIIVKVKDIDIYSHLVLFTGKAYLSGVQISFRV